jgi:hypothetical protein
VAKAGASSVGSYTEPILASGQTDAGTGPAEQAVRGFVARVRSLADEDRVALAEARRALEEDFREQALRSAAELLVGRAESYAIARRDVAGAHVPEGLDEDPARRDEVARLVELAIDELLVGLVTQDRLHPKHLRELYRPWRALDG